MSYYVYIVQCADNTLYTGITTDVDRRIDEHNGMYGKGAKYTRSRQPVILLYSKKFSNRASATSEELQIKKQSRAQKKKLIAKNLSITKK